MARDIDYMVKVMTAFKEGAKIEFRTTYPFESRWRVLSCPVWDWSNCDYRIKEEPKYRPYANAKECFTDVLKHGGWIISGGNQYRQITGIGYGCNSDIVKFNGCNWMKFGELMEAVWADDNSPCGVKE